MSKAVLVVRQRIVYGEDRFAEIVVWALPKPLPGSTHRYKYRLAYVGHGECVLRYDNEAGKGDHRHANGREGPYRFATLDKLFGAVQQKGFACVALALYWKKHLVKCEIALAKGKKEFDKRAVEKERDSNREIQRAVRHEQR